ncbi:MAG: hypothetical protein IT492_11445 [Gammaproteobacteria bacterium]|nr:hypothetical protein [Gammaproteobacteria bacterium]
MKTVWMALLAALLVGAAQAAPLNLEVHDASDGGLRLRDVEVEVLPEALRVSGRVQRAVALRSAAGRKVLVSVHGADGSLRAHRALAATALGLPRHGSAWSRFDLRLAVVAAPDDVVTVSIPAPGEPP